MLGGAGLTMDKFESFDSYVLRPRVSSGRYRLLLCLFCAVRCGMFEHSEEDIR